MNEKVFHLIAIIVKINFMMQVYITDKLPTVLYSYSYIYLQ